MRANASISGPSDESPHATYTIDYHNRCLWRGKERLELTPKAFEVLEFMRRNPGRLISHDEILDAVWPDTFVQPEIVKTYVRTLRRVLADNVQKPRFIETRPRSGYRFVGSLPETTEKMTLPARSLLVGRETERHQLISGFEAAAGGRRGSIIITGEAGLGKSALLQDFTSGLDRTGSVRVASAYGCPRRKAAGRRQM